MYYIVKPNYKLMFRMNPKCISNLPTNPEALNSGNRNLFTPLALLQFTNCRILRCNKIIKDDLWVRNGKIVDPEKVFFDEKITADARFDCHNAIIAPGFIELQINGGYGVDFSQDVDSIEKGVEKVAKKLLEQGITSFCPTIITSPNRIYAKVVPKIRRKQGDIYGASILGIHLEGPFINSKKKGAHPPNLIRDFDKGFETLREVYGTLENVAIVTLAPEKVGAYNVIKQLKENGVIVSVGHSSGDLCHGEEAVKSGATLITHLFNAMLPFHHRDPGLVGLLTSDDIPANQKVFYGIIADGVHTHPAALRIAYRTHPDGLILVTDAISAMGLPEGCHQLGQHEIEVKNGKAFLYGTNTLCGSIATMGECIRIFKKATNCPAEYAIQAATLHPAQCLGISSSKGTLNFRSDADFVFLNDDLEVISTWIAGQCVYSNDQKYF